MKYTACFEIECRRSVGLPWEFLARIDVPYKWHIVTKRFFGLFPRQRIKLVGTKSSKREALRRALIRATKGAEACWRISGYEDIRIVQCDRFGWRLTRTPIWQNARFLE